MRVTMLLAELKIELGNSDFLWVVALRILGKEGEESFFALDIFLYYWNYIDFMCAFFS